MRAEKYYLMHWRPYGEGENDGYYETSISGRGSESWDLGQTSGHHFTPQDYIPRWSHYLGYLHFGISGEASLALAPLLWNVNCCLDPPYGPLFSLALDKPQTFPSWSGEGEPMKYLLTMLFTSTFGLCCPHNISR